MFKFKLYATHEFMDHILHNIQLTRYLMGMLKKEEERICKFSKMLI